MYNYSNNTDYINEISQMVHTVVINTYYNLATEREKEKTALC